MQIGLRRLAILALAVVSCASNSLADPLTSWNDGTAKQAIISFVERVAKPGGPDFVPPAERLAVFDNDGTLWAEQPIYFQLAFAIDRVASRLAR